MITSWKRELDRKYRYLMNLGSISVIDRANTAILKAIELYKARLNYYSPDEMRTH